MTTPTFSTFHSTSTRMATSILDVLTPIGIDAVRETDSGSKFSHSVNLTLILTCSRNVNIPWPNQGMGDGDYLYAFQEVIMPIAYEFDPDLVISKLIKSLFIRTF